MIDRLRGVPALSAFVFLLFFLWLALFGPGALSLDRLLARWLKLDAKPAE